VLTALGRWGDSIIDRLGDAVHPAATVYAATWILTNRT